jgi:hypothetical protein
MVSPSSRPVAGLRPEGLRGWSDQHSLRSFSACTILPRRSSESPEARISITVENSKAFEKEFFPVE